MVLAPHTREVGAHVGLAKVMRKGQLEQSLATRRV